MRRFLLLSVLLLGATRAAFAVTCGGFSIVPADHVLVKYSAALGAGATHSSPAVSMTGSDVTVTRNVSGGSAVDSTCVDDTVDLGVLPGGRYNLTWNDNGAFTIQRTQFAFVVGAPSSGDFPRTTLVSAGLPDQPVRLALMACSPTAPVGYLVGKNINIVQYGVGSSLCPVRTLDFGVLPAGRYDVTPNRYPVTGWEDPVFSFVVQQPPASSACGKGFSVFRTPEGTTHLHVEDSFAGYSPEFGFPTASEIITTQPDGWNSITVTQPVTDVADRTRPGAAPTQPICHAEDLDLGVIPDGYYAIYWDDVVNVGGISAGDERSILLSFRLDRGSLQCTSVPTLQLWSVPIAGDPFQVARVQMDVDANGISLNVTRNGSVITVTEYLFHEGPIVPGPPWCLAQPATIGGLPAGSYTLIWNYSDPPDPRLLNPSVHTLLTTLTVANPARRRLAHH